jgi:hypothetical protein
LASDRLTVSETDGGGKRLELRTYPQPRATRKEYRKTVKKNDRVQVTPPVDQ